MRPGYAAGICAAHVHGRDGQDLRRTFNHLGLILTFSNAEGIR